MIKAIALFAMALFGSANAPADQQDFAFVSPTQQSGELEQTSRKAIIETGFSEAYFDEHFSIVATCDKPGDTRVVWELSVNGYETTISDAVGYYTDHQRRIYVHSVEHTLGSTRDITRTIARRKARALMGSCLGRFAGEAVALMRLSPGGKLSLYLTAHAINRRGARQPDAERVVNRSGTDVLERERTNRPISLGYINLETGKCSKGHAIVTP